MNRSRLELKDRVARAEESWSQGDSVSAHAAFRDLFREIVLENSSVTNFGENEFLVAQRYADLAAETGYSRDALDLYLVLQERAHDAATRASAGFKRLHLAVEAGEPFLAQAAYANIWRDTGVAAPPADLSDNSLVSWEAEIRWKTTDRPSLFSIMCLALGRMHNATRRLPESCIWLKRGLWHAHNSESRLARLSSIPLCLALANSYLAMGRIDLCRESLDAAAGTIEEESLGAVYTLWLGGTRAKASLLEGRYGDVLKDLAEVRLTAQQRGLDRAVRKTLVAQGEVLILLNQLQEAQNCLNDVEQLAKPAGDVETMEQVARVKFFRNARLRVFESLDGETSDATIPPDILHHDAVIWTGDCLRDYERRESLVYAVIDSDPSQASDDLRALWGEFDGVESRLIQARLRSVAGLLFARYGDLKRSAEYLSEARHMFREIRAERETYQATAYLIFAVEKSDPERYSRLVEENDLRLARLSDTLKPEQRNAYRLNKYTAEEQKLRVEIEAIIALKERAASASGWQWAKDNFRYRTRLHRFVASLDKERQQRRKQRDSDADFGNGDGIWGMLRRLTMHPRRNVTIGYIVLPDQTFGYSLRKWSTDCVRLSIGRHQVVQLVLGLRRTLFSTERKDSEAFDNLAEHVCKVLGIQAIISGTPLRVRHLTIVPDDALRLLPFSALRLSRNNTYSKYLIEDFTLNIDEISARRNLRQSFSSKAIAGYAERNLKDATKACQQAADSMRREWRLDCLTTDEKRTFLVGLHDSAVMYYFGHGYFHAADGDKSGLEFRGPDGANMVSLGDLDGLDMRHLYQAIVLACQGSDAKTFPGRWTVSLPEMLLRRGARSVLSSLWVLDQSIARRVSEAFFRDAPLKGRAASLAEIQRSLIRERRDPYTWAGLQVYGESGAMPVGQRWLRWRYRS